MQGGYWYSQTAQPQFQTAEYDFWNSSPVPGMTNFVNGQPGDLLIAPVGGSIGVNGYAKLAVVNAYSGVFGYLGQYFDQAYQIDTNGNVTTNTTGLLSPYGQFFATEPGPAALVTMPDIDTGQRGTGVVYAVGAVIDRNQGSPMDLYFSGANATSVGSPAVVWADNNFDRWHTVDGSDSEQDDLGAVDISKLPAYQQVPDCDYVNSYGQSAIPCTRDLEDYFRLWTPGVAALMKVLPSNYTVQLTLSGAGQIRIFQAIEANGGTNYLFDETTASNQVANSASLYVGLLTSSSPVVFSITTNFNEHFIFCGAQTGSAQIDLQVLDGNGNVVADAPVYLQINDIKEMYERWTVGEKTSTAPNSVATWQVDDLAFQYPAPQDTNTPYILFVHGWNMETWEKDRYAEAAYKRLYWQGYKGRFGSFRWPTGNGFSGIISVLFDARNYDNSESNAWASATGLLNKLNDLNAEYPGNVYLMAHSMGNVVAGEALRLATNQVVNTYVAMQGAVSAHCYDSSTANRATPTPPDRFAHYYTAGASSYFSASSGAGNYVNFYNTNDWALSWWNFDQSWKPDNLNYPGYNYSVSGLHPNGFYVQFGTGTNDFRNLNFPDDTYAIFAYGDPSWSFALGAQADVAGAFKKGSSYQEINLPSVWPADTHLNSTNNPYSAHVWHSAEFRSDNMSLAVFWNAMMKQMFP
jgi:pimeloyl-ACP methyl ester carboxylesterase